MDKTKPAILNGIRTKANNLDALAYHLQGVKPLPEAQKRDSHSTNRSEADSVHHPKHYNLGSMETIDIIDAMIENEANPSVAHSIGNAVKYMHRFRYKHNAVEDLEKARWYLSRAVLHIERENQK